MDERGLLVSEYMTSKIDKNAMAVMCSVLNGTSNRFIRTLKLNKLNSVVVNTPKGAFLIKDIYISNLNRKFTLSLFIEKKKSKGEKKSTKKPKRFKNILLKFFRVQKNENNGTNKGLMEKVDTTITEIQNIFSL